MVVSDEHDANVGDRRPVDAAIFLAWNRIVSWLEHEPPPAVQVESELPSPAAHERVRMADDKIRDTSGR
jgi:hypothetical protein